MFDVSTETVRWVLKEAERDPSKAFDMSPPHYCHVCPDAVPKEYWVRHLAGHRREMASLARRTERERDARLRSVNRLRRESDA